MTKRLRIPAAMLLLLFAVDSGQSEPLLQSPGTACTPGPRNAFLDGGSAGPPSPERLIDSVKVIVEAIVQSMQPPPPQSTPPRPRENDLVLIATRVLKGPETLQQFATAQIPASGFFEMQAGQHFILFLNEMPGNTANRYLERPGVPRYALRMDGILCVDEGKIRVSDQGNYLRPKFEGVPLEKAISDIRGYINIPRLNVRVSVEGGTYPPDGMASVPVAGQRDWRSEFKIMLKPLDAPSSPGNTRDTMAVFAVPSAQDVADTKVRIVQIDRSGAFALPMEKGSYQVLVDGLPFGYYLKSITYGSRDLTRESLRIDGASTGELGLVLTSTPPAGQPLGIRVGGRITGIPQELQSNRVWVSLASDASENVRVSAQRPMADGKFEFNRVPPGNYTLRVAPIAGAPAGLAWGSPSEVPVVVGDREVSVELPIFAGTPITAQLVDSNGNPKTVTPAALLRLTVQPTVSNTSPLTPLNLIPAADGSLRMWLAPGDYSFAAAISGQRGAAYTIRAISSGPTDLLKAPLKVDGKTPVPPIRITIE